MLISEEILGNLSDDQFQGVEVDYIDIDWYDAFKKVHRKTSAAGKNIGLQLGNDVLKKGMKQDDVVYRDGNLVIAVNIPPCEALVITVENDPQQIAKVCYEIGNKHATLFWGESVCEFITPLDLPIKALMEKLGIKVERKVVKFDFKKSISSSINAHTH